MNEFVPNGMSVSVYYNQWTIITTLRIQLI